MAEPSNFMVVAMGIITVFVALVVLILLIQLMSVIVKQFVKDSPAEPDTTQTSDTLTDTEYQKVKTAIAVAIAEEMGADVSHLKIHSIKKL